MNDVKIHNEDLPEWAKLILNIKNDRGYETINF